MWSHGSYGREIDTHDMGRMKSEKDLALKLSRKLVEKGVCSTFRYARKEKLKNIVQKLSTNNPFSSCILNFN